LKPWEVDELTPSELALALDDDLETRRAPHGGGAMSPAELEAYARAWRAMTPAERLARARER
jgi:hypothetical protein